MGNHRENRYSKHSRTTDGDIELPGVTLKSAVIQVQTGVACWVIDTSVSSNTNEVFKSKLKYKCTLHRPNARNKLYRHLDWHLRKAVLGIGRTCHITNMAFGTTIRYITGVCFTCTEKQQHTIRIFNNNNIIGSNANNRDFSHRWSSVTTDNVILAR